MSDYDKWFISTDGTNTAFLCKREKLIDALIDLLGAEKAAKAYKQFRRATFSESCRLELEMQEVDYVQH